MNDLFENPMGLDGFEFVEFASPKAGVLEPVFDTLGFTEVARHRSKDVSLYRQGDINFVLNREPKSYAAYFAEEHGPCACGMAFRVRDAHFAYKRALEQGAEIQAHHEELARRLTELDAREQIRDLVARARESSEDVEVRTRPVRRDPWRAVTRLPDEESIGTIVVGVVQGGLAGIALANARLLNEIASRERLEEELRIAARIQVRLRVGREFFSAAGAAESVLPAVVL